MGHKLIGNIEEIKNVKRHKGREIYYFTFSYKDYKKLKNIQNNILTAYYPTDMMKVFRSKIIISSHGLIFHNLLKNFLNIETFFTGHAIKSNNHKEILREQKLFTEVWLYSNFERDIYIEECNYDTDNLVTTGYPRIDTLNNLLSIKERIKKDIEIDSKLILYAPTDDRGNKNYKESILSPHNVDLYKLFEEISLKLNLKFLIKLHINTRLDSNLIDFINRSKNLIFYDQFQNYPDITALAISDLLITDWSSVFVDYLITDNSILFLNSPMAYDISGVSKVFDNDYIERVDSFNMLDNKITEAFNNNFKLQDNLQILKTKIFEGKFLDKSLERCLERLPKE